MYLAHKITGARTGTQILRACRQNERVSDSTRGSQQVIDRALNLVEPLNLREMRVEDTEATCMRLCWLAMSLRERSEKRTNVAGFRLRPSH